MFERDEALPKHPHNHLLDQKTSTAVLQPTLTMVTRRLVNIARIDAVMWADSDGWSGGVAYLRGWTNRGGHSEPGLAHALLNSNGGGDLESGTTISTCQICASHPHSESVKSSQTLRLRSAACYSVDQKSRLHSIRCQPNPLCTGLQRRCHRKST
ncbi:unnamed protein product [Protopolystoma xenopodis]|uniref:Uncharacterized protein n=1 Tax=Protopolystoma xenopodis TaxID=117903 RepID=A0A448WVV2_9PLAT|nr:unnamed protein product [Protopolystoma xenopodis]